MDPEIAALAAVAARELVRSMTGDGWPALRNGIARLLGLGDEQRAGRHVEQLDASREEVQREPERGDSVGGRWEGRLEALLEEHPALATELTRLVDTARRQRPAGGDDLIGRDVIISPSHGSIGAFRMGDVTFNAGSGRSGS